MNIKSYIVNKKKLPKKGCIWSLHSHPTSFYFVVLPGTRSLSKLHWLLASTKTWQTWSTSLLPSQDKQVLLLSTNCLVSDCSINEKSCCVGFRTSTIGHARFLCQECLKYYFQLTLAAQMFWIQEPEPNRCISHKEVNFMTLSKICRAISIVIIIFLFSWEIRIDNNYCNV